MWRARYLLPDGSKRSAGTFAHKKRAQNEAATAEANARSLGWRDPRAAEKTWGEWCAEWWDTRAVEPGTLHRDTFSRDLALLPKWGSVRLVDITRHDIKSWAATLARTGLAPATVEKRVRLLSASLAAAVDAEVITSNPAFALKLGGGQATHDRYLTATEVDLIASKLSPAWGAIFYFLAYTGLRWGEAAGLMWNRIDLERGVFLVAEVWDEDSGAMKAYPKDGRRRPVTLPPWLAADLTEGDPVLKSPRGYRPGSRNFMRAHREAAKEVGIAPFRTHDLRHTCASWMLQNGASLAEVGQQLGHTSPQTTARYAHLADPRSARVLALLPVPVRPNSPRSPHAGRFDAETPDQVSA